jgi:Homeodomain-like domain
MMVTGLPAGGHLFVCDDILITFWTAQRPSHFLGRTGGPVLGATEAPVVMVGSDVVEVDRRLRVGELVCPCGGGLAPWGHARRRSVRGVGDLRPRRARCRSCLVTHVLLATSCLLRRADGVEVIGAALRAKAAGSGHRPIAERLGRSASTVRGWLRAFARNGEVVRSTLTVLLVQLDPLTGPLPAHPSLLADAVEAVGACAAAARRRLGVVGAVSPWRVAAAVTGGRLLAPAVPTVLINTSRPLGDVV